MALVNPEYDQIGRSFVAAYYALFDDPNQRQSLISLYNPQTSFMSFEGAQVQGSTNILEKLQALSFQKINRIITTIDTQPMMDGGVLVNVLGRLQCDEDPPHAYSQVFVVKPQDGSFYCAHDIFRLNIHDTA